MPYFQRARSPGGAPPINAVVERSPAGIVEKAVSILDQQLATNGVGPAPAHPSGFAPPASFGTGMEIGDTYTRVHQLLQELLALLAAPGGSAPAGMLVPIPATAPVLQARPVKAGETLSVAVPLVNDNPNPVNLIFYSSAFVSDGGYEIPSLQVSFSPRTMTLAGNSRNHTEMKIAVPAQSPAGLYSALVQASGLSAPQAIVVLKVE